MKRILFLLVTVFVMTATHAQDISDGLLYSNEDITQGTARFQALSGAFGALGGDYSAVNLNPAGSAIFTGSGISATLLIHDRDNTANYFGTSAQSIGTDADIAQLSGVFVFNNPSEEAIFKKFAIILMYEQTQNFDNDLLIQGTSNASIADFFLTQAQGIPLDLLQLQNGETVSDLYNFLGENEGVDAQNAFLGYQAFIIDPVTDDPGNTQYFSNVDDGSFQQEYNYTTRGNNSKYTANVATQIKDNLFIGVNLNSHIIDYDQSTFLFERNSNGGSINQIGFENNLSVRGSGFSAQIGAIFKYQNLRLGASLQSPTWFEISEETTQSLQSRRDDSSQSIIETIAPNVINVFPDYQLRTPGKATASIAYIFGKSGLISFDYSYKDYSQIEFDSDINGFGNSTNTFSDLNNAIENTLKGVSTFRLGGEYRISLLTLRGGLRYSESPYEDENVLGDLNGFSAGLGYNFGNYNIDLAYSRAEQDRAQRLNNIGFNNAASVNTVYSNYVLTFSFIF